MRQGWGIYLSVLLFAAFCILLYAWQTPVVYLQGLISGHSFLSYGVFVTLLVIATVFMPVTVLPLIPIVSPIFGPFLTGVLSVIGWTIGAVGAFSIARICGRPFLERFIPLAKLDMAVERIPSETRFVAMVLLRMTVPVDIMSYALGLTRGIAFVPYLVATVVGVSYFSFAFAYLGDALFEKNNGVLLVLGSGSFVLFAVCWAILIRHMRTHNK